MRPYIFNISILLCLIMTACGLPYNIKTQFNDNELQWINIYNDNDYLLFSSEWSIDTVYIEKKTINNPRNTFIFDLEQGWAWLEGNNTYYATASLEYKLYHSKDTFCGVLMVLKKIAEEKSPLISFSFGGWYSDDMTTDSLANYQLNNHILDDCIIINHSNAHKGKHQKTINLDYFIWSKSKGLIEYKLKNGNVYKRHKLF